MSTLSSSLKPADFKSDQEIRWCPGCGDYSILAAIQRTMTKLDIPKEKLVFISGIGCSSRFPYYMNTYGFHTIHGRAPAVATGTKLANPDLSVWLITGDGDGLSIGGNHLMHLLRRNVDINVLLFNNEIYGLTKGQVSPTSRQGTTTKTSPRGSMDEPVNPVRIAAAAGASFVARTIDRDIKHMSTVFEAAEAHRGTSFVEIFQNCVIFNDGIYDALTDKQQKAEETIVLEPGQPLIFADGAKGIRFNGLIPEVVMLTDENRDQLHVHQLEDPGGIQSMIYGTMQEMPDIPTPIGIFHQSERPTFESQLAQQFPGPDSSDSHTLNALLRARNSWVVE